MSDLEYLIVGEADSTMPTPWAVLEVNPKIPAFRVLVAMFKEKAEAELFVDTKKHGIAKPDGPFKFTKDKPEDFIKIKENTND